MSGRASVPLTVTIKNGRSGPMFVWYDSCLILAGASQSVLAIARSPLATHLLAGALCVPLLVVGRRTGLFVSAGVLRLRFGGVTRWSVPLADVMAVAAVAAPVGTLWLRRAKTQPHRIEVQCGPRVYRLPRDTMSYMFSLDPKESACLTALALAKELRSIGATGLDAELHG
ncbi:unannotated protein [freshwater metagenome]|uniref:Unannotated protein n=2 Tax=freshwater metagenome TaxID=449393 RepID=A0A6J6A2M3_9ZZZZ